MESEFLARTREKNRRQQKRKQGKKDGDIVKIKYWIDLAPAKEAQGQYSCNNIRLTYVKVIWNDFVR